MTKKLVLKGVIIESRLRIAGIAIIPIYAIIQRAIYTRQKLLFVLVTRERDGGTPMEIVDKLHANDFQK